MLKSMFTLLAVCSLWWCGVGPAGANAAEGSPRISGMSSMEWRILPGESLNSLAELFYPRDTRMQQRFVAATIALNRELLQNNTPEQPFDEGVTINIPDLRALSYGKGGTSVRKSARHKPAMPSSSGVQQGTGKAADGSNGNAQAAYDALEKRNQVRAQELEKLNQRLKSLEESSQAMKKSLTKDALPVEETKGRQTKRVQMP